MILTRSYRWVRQRIRLGQGATRLLVLLLGLTLVGSATPCDAADPPLTPEQALEVSQAAIGRPLGDHVFRDEQGRDIYLSDYRGRPLVIAMVYTACSDACPLILQTVSQATADAWKALGPDAFSVVAVGFDTARDTPDRMRQFARQQGISHKNMTFLSGDAATVNALVQDVGFTFYVSPKGFDHISQATVVDAEGRIHRQVYGENFESPYLVQPLRELVLGIEAQITSLDDLLTRVRLFCTIYDPASGRYRFSFALFFELFVAGTVVLGLAGFVASNWRRLLRRQRRQRRGLR